MNIIPNREVEQFFFNDPEKGKRVLAWFRQINEKNREKQKNKGRQQDKIKFVPGSIVGLVPDGL